jgi:hypothetical protein
MIKSKLELVVWLCKKLGVVEQLQEYFESEVVRYENPIEELYQLDDEAGKIYVWKLKDDVRKKQASSFGKRIDDFYREEYGHDSEALHLTVEEVDDIKNLTPEEYKKSIPSWVKDA